MATAVAADEPRPIPMGTWDSMDILMPVVLSMSELTVAYIGRRFCSALVPVLCSRVPLGEKRASSFMFLEVMVTPFLVVDSAVTIVGRSMAIEIAELPFTTKCSPNRITLAGEADTALN